MTNPGNAIGTNAAYLGRTSVEAFNDLGAVYQRGVLTGWPVSPGGGLTVNIGGSSTSRDVAIAEDNVGNITTINNITQEPISVTIDAAPGSGSRIDLIVAYVDNPPQGDDLTTDNPDACGLVVVKGTASGSPARPDDNAIRSAITAEGASGATAFYVTLGVVTIPSGTTDLTSSNVKRDNVPRFRTIIANRSMFEGDNIAIGTNTPAAWKDVFNNGQPGVYWVKYTIAGRFTNQPSQYGFLETVINGDEIYQRWHTQANGADYFRSGNGAGWYGASGNAGVFRKIADSGDIKSTTGTIVSGNWYYSLVRNGNVVQFNVTAAISTAESAVDNYTDASWGTIPSGYRPIDVTGADNNAKGAICLFQQVTSPGTTEDQGAWRISADGKFHLYTNGWAASQKRFSGSTTWITNDSWP